MSLRFRKLRLQIPSLCQTNKTGKPKGNDWCGRTSASMIYNYYLAARGGGIDNTRQRLIINERHAEPYDLIFRDGLLHTYFKEDSGRRLAAYSQTGSYALQRTIVEIDGMFVPADNWSFTDFKKQSVYPRKDRQGEPPSEWEVQRRMSIVTRGLDNFNPCLFYSGLTKGTRHIVVISGYEMRGDELWLHIDDPGRSALKGETPSSLSFEGLFEKNKMSDRYGGATLVEKEATDNFVDDMPGVRYWIRARVLFEEDTVSPESDVFGDHGYFDDGEGNSPGIRICTTYKPEARSVLVQTDTSVSFPLKVNTHAPGKALTKLWVASSTTGAPYPLGSNRAWHDGIHIPKAGSGALDPLVRSLGPGELIAARLPEVKAKDPDRGVLIVRHAFDPELLRFYHPASAELAEGHHWVYSLYGNLAGGKIKLEKEKKANKGDGEDEENAEKPPKTVPAIELLTDRIKVGDRPKPQKFVSAKSALTLFAAVGTDKKAELRPLPIRGGLVSAGAVANLGAGGRLLEDDLLLEELPDSFAGDGASQWYRVPISKARTHLDAWTDQPTGVRMFGGDRFALVRRIEAQLSGLFAVYVDKGEWIIEDGVVRPNPDHTGDTLRLMNKVRVNKKGVVDFPNRETFYQVEKVDGLALPLVQEWESHGKRRALVEVAFAIRPFPTALDNNDEEIGLYNERKALYDAVVAELRGGQLVDFAQVEESAGITEKKKDYNSALRWREVVNEPLAGMGKLPKLPNETGRHKLGFHLEVFSETHMIQSSKKAAGTWEIVEDDEGQAIGTPEFLSAKVELLLVNDELRTAARAQPLEYHEPEPGGPIWAPNTVQDWVRFAEEHARALSQVVAVHGSEWAVDWDAVCQESPEDTYLAERCEEVPEEDRVPMLPGVLEDPAFARDRFHFYHPLRLIEWLSTGIDLYVTGLRDDQTLKPDLTYGDDVKSFLLVEEEDASVATFRIRLLLGDLPDTSPTSEDEEDTEEDDEEEPSYFLMLDDVDTSEPKIPVRLRRGVVQTISLVQPSVSIQVVGGQVDPAKVVKPVSFELLEEADDDTWYLLADNDYALSGQVGSQVTILAKVRYNLKAPNKVTIDIAGSGFTVQEVRGPDGPFVDGGDEIGTGDHFEYDLGLETPPKFVTDAREIAVSIDVVATDEFDTEAEVTVTFEGGDLLGPETKTIKVGTRTAKFGDIGDDIAKVQLYLSQIKEEIHPCYRGEIDNYDTPPAQIHGEYDANFAKGIWRFILAYGKREDWPEDLMIEGTIDGRAQSLNGKELATGEEIDIDYSVDEKKAYPFLTEPLVKEILHRYNVDNVLTVLSLTFSHSWMGEYHDVLFKPEQWGSWQDHERTSVLAADVDQGVFIATGQLLHDLPGASKSPVEIEFNGAAAYDLVGKPPATLAELCTTGIRFRATGKEVSEGKFPEIIITSDPGGSFALGGTPEYSNRKGVNGFAAALLQLYMAREVDGTRYYWGDIDGDWGDGSKKAYRKASNKAGKKPSMREVVDYLAQVDRAAGGYH